LRQGHGPRHADSCEMCASRGAYPGRQRMLEMRRQPVGWRRGDLSLPRRKGAGVRSARERSPLRDREVAAWRNGSCFSSRHQPASGSGRSEDGPAVPGRTDAPGHRFASIRRAVRQPYCARAQNAWSEFGQSQGGEGCSAGVEPWKQASSFWRLAGSAC